MATRAAKLGAGAFMSPGIAGVGPQGDIGLNRVPRAYVSSREAIGGNRDGRNDGENPYYNGKRGQQSGSDGGYTPEPGPYAGQ